jgi:hypothetical protein
MKQRLAIVVLASLVLMALLGAGTMKARSTFGGAAHVRWDIVKVLDPPGTVKAGGVASAKANDDSKVTLTGSGTFVAPAGGGGTSSAATGGGTWETFSPVGSSTGSGTYDVTGLVRWEQAPGTPPAPTDLIGDPAERSAGLVVLRVQYSDGERGTLVVSCRLIGTPDTVFEGITATKGFVDYWNRVAPAPGVDENRTLFHVNQ